jgi:pimeloyl-ACP methyl ester carboxylesterase
MATVEVGGVNLWYEFVGSGETVVQVGGAVSAHEGYATITPELSKHYRVLDYDHRGYGSSDRPNQKYTMDTWCDDLAGLMDALGVERAHVHGGSMGSFIAINFAANYPEKVDKLLLGAGAVAKCDRMATLHFKVWQHIASAYGIASRELAEELLTKAFSRGYLDGSVGGDEVLAEMQDVTARNASLPVFLDACDVMIDTDVTDRLDAVTAPTLVMVGSEDVLTPLDMGPDGAGARYVAEHLPDARLEIFEGSGHGHYIEQAEESITAILEFLGS